MGEVDTDVECTPPCIYEPVLLALGITEFGTDPCTNLHATVPAKYRIMLPVDGLQAPWTGSLWCNPPYSKPRPWVERCCFHSSRDAVAALLSGDFSTSMWEGLIWPTSTLVVLLHKRPRFFNPARPDRKTTAKRPGALVFWGINRATFNPSPLARIGKLVWK